MKKQTKSKRVRSFKQPIAFVYGAEDLRTRQFLNLFFSSSDRGNGNFSIFEATEAKNIEVELIVFVISDYKFNQKSKDFQGSNLFKGFLFNERDERAQEQIDKMLESDFFINEDSFKLNPKTAIDGLLESMVDGFNQRAIRESKARQIKDYLQKNRELAALQTELQQWADLNKQKVLMSESEIDLKQKKIRDIIRFINELSQVETIAEVLLLLKKEMRVFRHLKNPIVCFCLPDGSPQLISVSGKQIEQRRPKQYWDSSKSIRTNRSADRQYLADQLSRPIGAVIAIPLPVNTFGGVLPNLFLELNQGHEQLNELLDFLTERLQPLSVAVERILLSDQLRTVSVQWEKTFEAIQDPVAIIDIDFRVLRANSFFSRYAGESRCFSQFTNQGRLCVGCPMPDSIALNSSQMGHIRLNDRVFEVRSFPIRWGEDKFPTTAVNHYLDVTENRALYLKMIQSEKMAALGLLAANIAHELNNPLTGLKSLSQFLRASDSTGATVKEDLFEIEKAAERCEKIIRNLLDFTQPELQSTGRSVQSLGELVKRTMPFLKTAARDYNVGLELTDQSDAVFVEPSLVQQVIFNLVNNACQAMKSRVGMIQISTAIVTEGQMSTFVALHVKDAGVGISAVNLVRIFEPFFTTKEEGEGTGLGLSMSKSVIEKFGGRILVESQPDLGTTFTVLLPLAVMSPTESSVQ